ncbi:MAG: nuclear transport factor 2 family protein [Acidobacteria bacterium]|nr:nuclear transport factor 2 family protein [Acidobacteriota bacterium]MCA1619936.1 nuclear transport factor 2 family protein [Acidobacteriota bacterium]
MKRSSVRRYGRRAAALVLAVAAAGAAVASPAAGAAHDPAEHVRKVLTRNAAALERGDMAALDKIWANDASVTVFESGHANYGWADYRDKHLAPELKEMKNVRYTISDVRAKVSGTTAWATFKYALAADAGARRVEVSGLGTAVLERRGQEWRIVHWHTSAPRRAPSSQPNPAPHKH